MGGFGFRNLFEDRNPADASDVIGLFQQSVRSDVDRAIEAAERAYQQWRLVPAKRAESCFGRLSSSRTGKKCSRAT